MIRTDDFLPLPCNVDSAAITLLYRHGEEFVPIPRKADVRGYLSLLDNTLAFYAEDVLQNAARAFLCADRSCDCMRFLKDVVPFIPMAVKGRLGAGQARVYYRQLLPHHRDRVSRPIQLRGRSDA